MFNILGTIPSEVHVAFSGGVDSVAVVDFLSRKHKVTCVWFNHRTEDCQRSKLFVEQFCKDRNLDLIVGASERSKFPKESLEEYWRNVRYEFFDSLNVPIITGHNLDDCVETFIHSSMHGKAKVIPYSRRLVYRPFLLNKKSEFLDWANRKNLSWHEDESNSQMNLMRNYIRKNVIEHALVINPGLYKTVRKIVESKF